MRGDGYGDRGQAQVRSSELGACEQEAELETGVVNNEGFFVHALRQRC